MTAYTPLATFVDVALPLLPGDVLPLLPGAVGPVTLRVDVTPSTDTATLSRAEFAKFVETVAVWDTRTVIVERPQCPYEGWSKVQLYRRARELKLPRRSTYTKAQLRKALIAFEGR